MNEANATSFLRGLRGMWSHPDPVQVIANIDFESAGASMPGNPHTIWQILRHTYGWCWLSIDWARPDDNFPDPDKDNYFFPEKAPENEEQWKAAQSEMQEIVDALKEILPDIDLEHKYENLHNMTSGDLLMILTTHTSYHMGQISMILKTNGKMKDMKDLFVEDVGEL